MEAKTLEEHREYLYEIIRLKLFYAFTRHRNHPDEDFRFLLRERVDIVRKTRFFTPGITAEEAFAAPEYTALENRLIALAQQYRNDAAGFETAGFMLLKPELDRNCAAHYARSREASAHCSCGFLRPDLTAYAEFPGQMAFHIANDREPASFFDDPAHIRTCFTQLLDVAENQMHVETIFCCSWLNSLPRWLALFPDEWSRDHAPENHNVEWHYGFWGQFINARGVFNAHYGARLRATGTMPYAHRYAHCRVSALRRKLSENSDH